MPPARFFAIAAVAAAALMPQPGSTAAEALLLVEADSGKVLFAENATHPWYPASVTKLMTAYVTLRAIKEQRITPDTLLTVSGNAVAQQPSKMGFKAGIRLTVDNALKMMMVKSANDIAVVLAEGVSGSIDAFATEMNRAAQRLGMTQSSFVNPNGLPADGQITSARDLAILTRALIREFPEYEMLWRLPAIKFGRRVLHNHNPLIDRYPGADGMKTGFICASGFNLVATATHGNRRLIAVVLGAPSSAVRTDQVVQLFEKGFSGTSLSWLLPSLGTVDALRPVDAPPPNLREDVCGKNRHRAAETVEEEPPPTGDPERSAAFSALLPDFRSKPGKSGTVLGPLVPSMPPMVVFVGPPKKPGNPEAALAKEPGSRAEPRRPKAAKPALAATKATVTPPAQPSRRHKPAASAPAAAAPASSAPTAAAPAAPPAAPPSDSLFHPAPTIAPTSQPKQ